MSGHALSTAVSTARQALDADRFSHLERPYRQLIWLAFGPAGDIAAWKMRTDLAISAARYVMPAWQATFPDDVLVKDALELAASQNSVKPDESTRRAFRMLVSRIEKIEWAEHLEQGINAGYASVQAVRTALYDEDMEYSQKLDSEFDYLEWDASYYAMLSFAGAPLNAETSDRRRSFWFWYLETALAQSR